MKVLPISKSKRKEIALLHFDMIQSLCESLDRETLKPYLDIFLKWNQDERAYFFGLVAGTYNKYLSKSSPEQASQARKYIMSIIDAEKS